MGDHVRDALTRFCGEGGWSYAVFWRAMPTHNTIHLVWGDGHCERTRGLSGFEAMDLLLKEQGFVRDCSDRFQEHGCQDVLLVKLVHKTMAQQIHFLGDGIVGRAAVTGEHQWILQEDIANHGSFSKLLAEMNDQFLAGIQTIAVIPVLPYGVVQLGSVQMVLEDTRFVKHVRFFFAHLGHMLGSPLTPISQSSSSLFTKLHGKMPSVPSVTPEIPLRSKQIVASRGRSVEARTSHILQQNSLLDNGAMEGQVFISNSGMKSIEQALSYSQTSGIEGHPLTATSALSSSVIHVLEEPVSSTSSCRLEFPANTKVSALGDTKPKQLKSGCMFPHLPRESNGTPLIVKDEQISSIHDVERATIIKGGVTGAHEIDHNLDGEPHLPKEKYQSSVSKWMSNDSGSRNLIPTDRSSQSVLESVIYVEKNDSLNVKDSCFGLAFNSFEDSLSSNGKLEFLHNLDEDLLPFFMQPTPENDLFDVVGLDSRKDQFHRSSAHIFVQKDCKNVFEPAKVASAGNYYLDAGPVASSLDYDISCSAAFSDADPDQLLDAVVSKASSSVNHSQDDSVSCRTSLTKIGSSIHVNPPTWSGPSSQQKQSELVDLSSLILKKEAADSISIKSEESSQKSGGYRSQISLWAEHSQNLKCNSMPAIPCKRVDEMGKLNRKRVRSGENPRPRPKDRQMIQDRVKELREIVPNGAKCSIDALLEKTIKHMLFLQSVTNHADKLKETGEPKIISKDGGLLLKDNFEGGATWAFEVGSQSMICPIIVEDLNPPRQMLVEMLCEERGFFLEIADFIRGLGLTILKGVMEYRKDKVWAHFAVEANRDVTRMEVFLSLVRLLEPSNGSSLKPQSMDNITMPKLFHQSSIPATGSSSHLQ